MRIISDAAAIMQIGSTDNRYLCWVGAGGSVEAGVRTAAGICEDIRKEFIEARQKEGLKPKEIEEWIDEKLHWQDSGRRYLACIQAREPNLAKRVDFFRRVLQNKQPTFFHHAVALLMARGRLKRTCLTTNFDHLLEHAFAKQGIVECQSLRSDSEKVFWEDREDRHFVVKLHGDIDTQNILNTAAEMLVISRTKVDFFWKVTAGAALVVLGASGNEQSVRDLFRQAISPEAQAANVLSYGLMWGVYMGMERPEGLSENQLKDLVKKRIETEIHRDIVEIIKTSTNELFCFFPVWDAGSFMWNLTDAFKNDRALSSEAARYLDHELRLRRVFTQAGYPKDTVEKHLRLLREQRQKLSAPPRWRTEPETILTVENSADGLGVCVTYGDISSRALLADGGLPGLRRAVVSPDDTFVSAGGGVAYSLLVKAGPDLILNELAKFTPVEQTAVVVTSGGSLPVHYIFHAAALKIDMNGTYLVTQEDVRKTVGTALKEAVALGVELLFVPLLGAGLAPLSSRESFEAILQAVRDGPRPSGKRLRVNVVIYQERLLPRHEVKEQFDTVLGGLFAAAT